MYNEVEKYQKKNFGNVFNFSNFCFRYPPLLEKLRELQWKVHCPPRWENTEILVMPGSQDGICKAIEMSLEPGEPIIVQHPLYSGTEAVVSCLN